MIFSTRFRAGFIPSSTRGGQASRKGFCIYSGFEFKKLEF